MLIWKYYADAKCVADRNFCEVSISSLKKTAFFLYNICTDTTTTQGSCDLFRNNKKFNFVSAQQRFCIYNTAWKVCKYGVISGPCFSVFGLNTEIYGNLLSWNMKIYTAIFTMRTAAFLSLMKRVYSEPAVQRCFLRKGVLKTFINFTGEHPSEVWF